MTTVSLLSPNPSTLHLSQGDATSAITYQASIADPAENPATFKLEIIDIDVTFANGQSSVTWQVNNLTKDLTTQPAQQETFHLKGKATGTEPCGLKLTATDKTGISTDSNNFFMYF